MLRFSLEMLCWGDFNSLGAKFQTTFVICFLFRNKLSLGMKFIAKLKDWMSNSVDPDEKAHLDLCYLQFMPILSPLAVKELMATHNICLHMPSWVNKIFSTFQLKKKCLIWSYTTDTKILHIYYRLYTKYFFSLSYAQINEDFGQNSWIWPS